MESELRSGDDRIAEHVFCALDIKPRVFQERIGGSVMVLEKPSASFTTIMTAGVSRLPVNDGLPVELAVEVLPDQVGAALAALRIVCDDIATKHRTPPVETPWCNDKPFLNGTRIFAIAATTSRHGDTFDTVRSGDGAPIGKVLTLRMLTAAESRVLAKRGWHGLVEAAGGADNLLDVTRSDAARPTILEVDGPMIVSKLHHQYPPRWITADEDDMYTSVTGCESQEYMDDSTNHEIWARSTFAAKFPWVSEFLTAAAPNDIARFDDTSGTYTLEHD
ncbi:3-octaprenyl-4-hydroxybenzoate carboxy-lyase [Mycobacteroides chelonae]|uniref:3-octaprenyl-4-hydroxybenzoate carboxy-lyase n=1 Tax=Mycobacteroides chelonae TaxID=1774 RepID=UPI0018B0916B|nr:3-octaprenyl-4-hydroxybenzoate carboxy-lyase [Mycobacteroides chelonae]MBF9328428.1 3-octaprenyl-4-hydroxybenzoate carboxy-lyase [Mycobacteroides chelonae]MBF9422606.1 3-octaprenyl-4-hydroxybenzoate carboxy-lyase [Mycobacteroides chelonae]